MLPLLFTGVQKLLQVGVFLLSSHRTCSSLFMWVGVGVGVNCCRSRSSRRGLGPVFSPAFDGNVNRMEITIKLLSKSLGTKARILYFSSLCTNYRSGSSPLVGSPHAVWMSMLSLSKAPLVHADNYLDRYTSPAWPISRLR